MWHLFLYFEEFYVDSDDARNPSIILMSDLSDVQGYLDLYDESVLRNIVIERVK